MVCYIQAEVFSVLTHFLQLLFCVPHPLTWELNSPVGIGLQPGYLNKKNTWIRFGLNRNLAEPQHSAPCSWDARWARNTTCICKSSRWGGCCTLLLQTKLTGDTRRYGKVQVYTTCWGKPSIGNKGLETLGKAQQNKWTWWNILGAFRFYPSRKAQGRLFQDEISICKVTEEWSGQLHSRKFNGSPQHFPDCSNLSHVIVACKPLV